MDNELERVRKETVVAVRANNTIRILLHTTHISNEYEKYGNL
jgi:hypothetical protein